MANNDRPRIAGMLSAVLQPWHDALQDPSAAQLNVLQRFLPDYARTEYGVSHGAGRIASIAQEYILQVEAEASAKGLAILKEIGIHDGELHVVKEMMSRWYVSYENQCSEDVVKKVREKIVNDKNPAFEML